MKTAWLSPEDSRWSIALQHLAHDVYHLPGYVEVAAGHEGGRPVAFLAEEGESRFLVPLLVRDVPVGLADGSHCEDATGPYGYATPLLTPGVETGPFVEAFVESASGLGLVTAFWRLHPLLPLELSHPRLELVEHGETVYVDLSLSPQDQWAEVRPRLRSQIRKLGREGFSVTWDDWSRYGEFIELYDTTMKHVGASSGYFFGLEYFRGLQSALGPHLHLGLVETADGQLACGALLTEIGGLVEYHLGGTAMAWRQAGPSRLLFDAARHHFAARGNHKLHLGGGLGGQRDSLFRFKAGFSKHRARFSTARLVLDIDTTARLDATWQEAHTMAAVDPKYFPGYRQIPRAA